MKVCGTTKGTGTAVQDARIVHPFAPVYDGNSRILILGTMPSPVSRENGFGFAPRNRLVGRFTFMPDIGRKRRFHKRTCRKRFTYFSAYTAHIHNRQNRMEAIQRPVLPAHEHSGRLPSVHERRKPRPLAPRKTYRSI